MFGRHSGVAETGENPLPAPAGSVCFKSSPGNELSVPQDAAG